MFTYPKNVHTINLNKRTVPIHFSITRQHQDDFILLGKDFVILENRKDEDVCFYLRCVKISYAFKYKRIYIFYCNRYCIRVTLNNMIQ